MAYLQSILSVERDINNGVVSVLQRQIGLFTYFFQQQLSSFYYKSCVSLDRHPNPAAAAGHVLAHRFVYLCPYLPPFPGAYAQPVCEREYCRLDGGSNACVVLWLLYALVMTPCQVARR